MVIITHFSSAAIHARSKPPFPQDSRTAAISDSMLRVFGMQSIYFFGFTTQASWDCKIGMRWFNSLFQGKYGLPRSVVLPPALSLRRCISSLGPWGHPWVSMFHAFHRRPSPHILAARATTHYCRSLGHTMSRAPEVWSYSSPEPACILSPPLRDKYWKCFLYFQTIELQRCLLSHIHATFDAYIFKHKGYAQS